MQSMLNLEADGLKPQKTTPSATPHVYNLHRFTKIDNRRLDKWLNNK